MDIGYPHARPCDRPTDRVASMRPELSIVAARMASFLGAGGHSIVLTGPPESGKTALMERVLSGLSGLVTRVRAEPGGAPLGLAAILRQMNEPPPDDGDETALFLRTIAVAAYDEYSAVLAIDDAHTLSPDTLQVLARVPGLGGTASPGMILLLVGEPSLLSDLAAPGLEVFGNARRTLIARTPAATHPAEPAPARRATAPDQRRIGTPGPAPRPDRWLARHRRDLALVSGALLVGASLATAALTWPTRLETPRTQTVDTQPAAPDRSEPNAAPPTPMPMPIRVLPPAMVEPAAAAPPPVPMPTPAIATVPPLLLQSIVLAAPEPLAAAPAAPQPGATAPLPAPPAALPTAPPVAHSQPTQAQLRLEFDAFLNRAGPDTARLAPAARASLWREFLQWRAARP